MSVFYLKTILLALVWVAVTGSFTLVNLLLGFAMAAIALFLAGGKSGSSRHVVRAWCLFGLTAVFLRELVLSAWRVAWLVVSPQMNVKPGIFAYPLKADTDFEIALLANLITLTPGTLSVDVSADRRTLYVHAIDCSDPEQTIREIQQGFERRIMETFR